MTAEELYIFNHQAFNQNNNRNGFDLNQFLLLAVEAPEDYRKIDPISSSITESITEPKNLLTVPRKSVRP